MKKYVYKITVQNNDSKEIDILTVTSTTADAQGVLKELGDPLNYANIPTGCSLVSVNLSDTLNLPESYGAIE